MAEVQTRPWDVTEHLKTEENIAAYLEAAMQEGDPALVTAVLEDIARALAITQSTRKTLD